MSQGSFSQKVQRVSRRLPPWRLEGRLKAVVGLLAYGSLPASVGDQCEIVLDQQRSVLAEVVGFRGDQAILLPYETGLDLRAGLTVRLLRQGIWLPVGHGLIGRVLDPRGQPIDNGGPLRGVFYEPLRLDTPEALQRKRIRDPLVTGQRVIDGLMPIGQGQRIGIFAGSGVGKSTLLGELAKGSKADRIVVALVGERGREVLPFLEDSLGEQGRARSVVLVATSDQSPLLRVRCCQSAVMMAGWFRSRGEHVVLLMDSLTRLAMAQREIGLSLGEPPSARGYTPSVFQTMAGVLEAMGTDEIGSVTGILTVLVDGDDLDEPVADAARAMLDGHIVLERKLAERGQFPAINALKSLSRVAPDLMTADHAKHARKIRQLLSTYQEAEDLIRIGAYQRGSSATIDMAIQLMPQLTQFLAQQVDQFSGWEQTLAQMAQLVANWPG